MHNDLWKGNILLKNCYQSGVSNKLGRKDFVLTDWGGSMMKGYAIYDLIRAARSLKLKKEDLRQQIAAHCQILQCDFTEARYYLLAALGYLGMNLEHFPQHLFVGLAHSSLEVIEEIQK
jgi:hypothetical protein